MGTERKELIKVRNLKKVYRNGKLEVEALKNINITVYMITCKR